MPCENRDVVEFDGYIVPEQGEDTPENRKNREAAMLELKKQAEKWLSEPED